jgi:Tol biopolymer transport system component/DNA-binding winged helix-turn-helix (wHTH) protein
VAETVYSPRLIRFATFEVDLQSGELRKSGLKLKLTGQPFQVLAILLESPGEVVTREELQKRLWPDTFVDVDHNLNTAINKIREVLGDSAESPRFVETIPRRGYRFIAHVNSNNRVGTPQSGTAENRRRTSFLLSALVSAIAVLIGSTAWFEHHRHSAPDRPVQRALTRITFEEGLQLGATWSPDGQSIAYSSDRGGKFDIWIKHLSGGEAIQITSGPGQHWQPDWSPDGKFIAYRSEEGVGGLYIVPAPGGAGSERKVSSFGFYPRWSPDSSRLLFRTSSFLGLNHFYVVGLDGGEPQQVLKLPAAVGHSALSATWHPDGKRVSAWVGNFSRRNFWTVPVGEGSAIQSDISAEVLKQLQEVGYSEIVPQTSDSTFSWAPNGTAIYCELGIRGVVSLWRIAIDPVSLRMTGIERLTTGPGPDSELALSRDGRKVAFTSESQQIRVWVYPFDATRGTLKGSGVAVSPVGMVAWRPALSRSGTKIAFSVNHAGKLELWEKSLVDGRLSSIFADEYWRDDPVWSPNDRLLAYDRTNFSTGQVVFATWSTNERNETVIADAPTGQIHGWSLDSKSFLASSTNQKTDLAEILLFPLSAAPHAEKATRKILTDANLDLYQSEISPDGQSLVFMTVKDLPNGLQSKICVTPTKGGPWIPITEGKYWEDKPRWSPNGKVIYYVSGQRGSFNIWGMRFDPVLKIAVGEPFAVTKFDSPANMIPEHAPSIEIGVDEHHLVIPIEQTSGGIWVLEDVDR